MNDKVLKKFSEKYRAYFSKVVSVEFIERKSTPMLFLDWDKEASYTDHTEIHIGLQMFKNYAEKESDLFWMTMYVLKHEMQHVKSTVSRDWENGQKLGRREVLLNIANTSLGGKVRLVKESDYERLLEALQKKGIYVSLRQIGQLVHFVLNSVEDGRIENIAAAKSHTFEQSRRAFRGMLWLADDGNMPDELDACTQLNIILNQILTIATSGVYEKGFLEKYEGTDLHKKVRCVTPMIRRGTSAKTCREGMKAADDIVRELAPDIAEAAKAPEEFAKILNMIVKILEESGNDSFSASSSEEEKGTGRSVPVLEKSDDGSESGKNADSAPESDNSSASSSEEENSSGQSESAPENPADSSEQSDKNADSTPESDNSSASSSEEEKGAEASPSAPEKTANNSQKSDPEAAKKAVEKAMEEATKGMKKYEEMAEEVEKEEARLKKEASSFKHPKVSPAPAISAYSYDVQFNEVGRKYTPDTMPPADVVSRGAMLRRSIEKVLKQKRNPDQRGMRSGRIDSSRLDGLIFSDTKLFKRLGDKKKPDCAVFLLGDNSGSMSGSNRFYCMRSFAVAEEAFRGLAKMKIAVFDSYGQDSVTHEVVKDFDEEFSGSFSCSFLEHGRTGYGNKDGYSIRVATKQLLARPEEDKILLVASDGLPSDYRSGFAEGIADVKDAVHEARKAGITVIGMYMSSDSESSEFEEMYAPHAIITPFEEMSETLGLVLKNAFLKR